MIELEELPPRNYMYCCTAVIDLLWRDFKKARAEGKFILNANKKKNWLTIRDREKIIDALLSKVKKLEMKEFLRKVKDL